MPRQELHRYLVALLTVAPTVKRAGAITDGSFKAFKPDDTSTWPAFEKASRRSLDAITAVEAKLAAITPPKPPKSAHARLLKSWRLAYEETVFVTENLRLRQLYASWWRGWETRHSAAQRGSHQWEVAVRAEALRQHLVMPKGLF